MPQVPVSPVGPECLTRRERGIVKHIALGKTNPEIAAALGLSVKTVDWHRTNLMKKLDIHTVGGLVRYALLHGLSEEDEWPATDEREPRH